MLLFLCPNVDVTNADNMHEFFLYDYNAVGSKCNKPDTARDRVVCV